MLDRLHVVKLLYCADLWRIHAGKPLGLNLKRGVNGYGMLCGYGKTKKWKIWTKYNIYNNSINSKKRIKLRNRQENRNETEEKQIINK